MGCCCAETEGWVMARGMLGVLARVKGSQITGFGRRIGASIERFVRDRAFGGALTVWEGCVVSSACTTVDDPEIRWHTERMRAMETCGLLLSCA
jgi:hypothetical protein